jgi:hypothetical protein
VAKRRGGGVMCAAKAIVRKVVRRRGGREKCMLRFWIDDTEGIAS